MLVSDLWFSNVDGTLQNFSELRLCSLLNVIDSSEFFNIAATDCLNVVFTVCLFTSVKLINSSLVEFRAQLNMSQSRPLMSSLRK